MGTLIIRELDAGQCEGEQCGGKKWDIVGQNGGSGCPPRKTFVPNFFSENDFIKKYNFEGADLLSPDCVSTGKRGEPRHRLRMVLGY